ncbi:hypothetical protein D9758_004957 [Tetrapyrgos nigripes]|uniref:Uncharacterized protein n=1 Tax=Tetrapyrgos nigripes TaxID=182062 RepID=A0A8H5GVN8_9AGAR|nr:hypothetical protein D9758_004957 [Tetrapyrgos nigripes]
MELFRGSQNISLSDNSSVNVNNYGTIVQKEYVLGKHRLSDEEGEEIADPEAREKRLRLRAILDDFEEYRHGNMIIDRIFGSQNQRKVQLVRLRSWRNESAKTFVAISYEGRKADKASIIYITMWFKDLKKYSRVREPNALQLYAFTRSKQSPSLIFHSEERLPFDEVLKAVPPIVCCYLLCRLLSEEQGLHEVASRFHQHQYQIYYSYCGVWVQTSNGMICYGPDVPGIFRPELLYPHQPRVRGNSPLPHCHSSDAVINYIHQYLGSDLHSFIGTGRMSLTYQLHLPEFPAISLGALYCRYSKEPLGYIPFCREEWTASHWNWNFSGQQLGVLLENGWTRQVSLHCITRWKEFPCYTNFYMELNLSPKIGSTWLAQASWIFHEMGVNPCQYQDFYFVDSIQYTVKLEKVHCGFQPEDIFLFLPPFEEIQGFPKGPPFSTKLQSPFWSLTPRDPPTLAKGLPPFSMAIWDYQWTCGHDPHTNTYCLERGMPNFVWNPNPNVFNQDESNHEAIFICEEDSYNPNLDRVNARFNRLQMCYDSLKFHMTDCLCGEGAMNYMGHLEDWVDGTEAAEVAEVQNSLVLSDLESDSGSDDEGKSLFSLLMDPWESIHHLNECHDARLTPLYDTKYVWDYEGESLVHRGRRDSLPHSWAPQEYSLQK